MILSPLPVQKFFANNGRPLAGGLLFTYVAGTNDKIATYTDASGSSMNTNPVVLDFRGECRVWLDPQLTYKFVLSQEGDSDPPTRPIWTEDKIAGGVTVETLTQQFLGQIIYPRTQTEIDQGVVPTFYIYAPSPRIDPRRYGVKGDGVANDTAAFQTTVNIAHANNGHIVIPEDFHIRTSGVSLTMAGNRLTQGLAIEGANMNSSRIIQIGTPADGLIYIAGATPEGDPYEVQLVLENFSMLGDGRNTAGILLNGLCNFRISNVQATEFLHGLFLRAALIGTVDQNCQFTDNVNGIYCRPNTTNVGPNLVTIRECRLNANSSWGLDYGGGDRLKLIGCDLEFNGTPDDTATGAVVIRNTVSDATGYSSIDLDGNWFERNRGQTVLVEDTEGLYFAIRNCVWYNDEDARTLKVLGCDQISIADCTAPFGGGAVFDLTATYAYMRNTICGTLTDTGVTYPTYFNVRTSLSEIRNGRKDSFVGTLTGCTTSPTATVVVYQQADDITLDFLVSVTGVSNSTACTLTGLPAKYRPASDTIGILMIQDNGVNSARPCHVAAATGVITLGYGQTLTNSGTKGIIGGQLDFRRS
jgi:hypothetical protein